MMNKVLAVVATIVAVFNFYSPVVNADTVNDVNNFFKAKAMTTTLYVDSLGRLPSIFEIFDDKNGKDLSYDLLHSEEFQNKDLTEGDIVDIYYNIFLGQEATDWDREFWSKRITKDDTTILLYGLINSETFTTRCEENGLNANDYFIEDGVFYEGICPLSEECGLTDDGNYVFYATFGNSTYYHVVEGAVAVEGIA